jgi:NitT/TauT family transport system ATP-binding protein
LLELWRQSNATVIYVTHDIDEALLLADRITVLTARPTRARATFNVPFARPRSHAATRRDAAYAPLYERCQALLEPTGHAAPA